MLFKQIPRTELALSGLPPRITPPTTPSKFILRQESTLVTLVSARKISPRGVRLYWKKSGARLAASWGWSKTRAENVGGGDVFSFFSLVCYLFSPSFLLLSFSFSFSFFFFFFSLRRSRLTSSPHVKITGLTVSRAEANRGVTAAVS